MRTTLQWMFYTLLLGVAFFGLIVLLGPRFSDFEILTVLSPSMSPTIPMGSVVVIKPVDIHEIQVGDVITFRSLEITGRRVTHRVVEILDLGGNPAFRTQGDANDAPDIDPIPSSLVQGKVMFNLPIIGYLIQFIRKPLGFALIIGIPALLVLIGEVQELLNLKKQRKRTAHADD